MTEEIEEIEVSTQLKNELTYLADFYIYKYTPSKYSLKKHKILQTLRPQKSIITAHPDKGNGLVILDRSDNIKSMEELVSDNDHTAMKREQALQRTLRKLKNIFLVKVNILIYIQKVINLLDCMVYQKFIYLFHQVLFLLYDLLFLRWVLIIINSLSILVLYFHHIFPQTMQPRTVSL